MKVPICVLEPFLVGDSRQWALVRGTDRTLPVLLVLQSGPGFSIIHEADALETMLRWEQEFVVVYWDQRGCGKSFGALNSDVGFSIGQMTDDLLRIIENLKKRLEVSRIFLLGFSLGATIGAMAAKDASESLHALICTGTDIDLAHAEKTAYAFALKEAKKRRNRRAEHEVRDIVGASPVTDAKRFFLRAKWLTEFGGMHRTMRYRALLFGQIRNILSCRFYSWRDRVGTFRGMRLLPDLLLKEIGSVDLFRSVPRLDVPVFFLQGRHDALAPADVAERYFDRLDAPEGKELVWFESSAHMPHYEEPGLFVSTLISIRNSRNEKNFPIDVID